VRDQMKTRWPGKGCRLEGGARLKLMKSGIRRKSGQEEEMVRDIGKKGRKGVGYSEQGVK